MAGEMEGEADVWLERVGEEVENAEGGKDVPGEIYGEENVWKERDGGSDECEERDGELEDKGKEWNGEMECAYPPQELLLLLP